MREIPEEMALMLRRKRVLIKEEYGIRKRAQGDE